MTDLLSNQARALALRGKLIAAGFDPLTVAYNPATGEYVVVLPENNIGWALEDWIETMFLRVVKFSTADDTVTITVKEAV